MSELASHLAKFSLGYEDSLFQWIMNAFILGEIKDKFNRLV